MIIMVEGVLKRIDDFGSFGGFQRTNFGRKFYVFCQHLTLDLGGQACGRRIQI